MIKFILNNKLIETEVHPGTTVLDFVRYHQHLCGTKIGCREGDCGACTVLVGELKDDKVRYRSMTSCLMPLANAAGKHIVTVEGINTEQLTPVQQAMHDESATQCGFCTPGFVMSLTGFAIKDSSDHSGKEAIASVDGNICRCTGYKSIQRAAVSVATLLAENQNAGTLEFAVSRKIVPDYFLSIAGRLKELSAFPSASPKEIKYRVAGGTDLYVQKHGEMTEGDMQYFFNDDSKRRISVEGQTCILGPAVTVTDLVESEVFNKAFPDFESYFRLVSSTPIRNMATIAGNFVNASPIGDFTAFFLAAGAKIVLYDDRIERVIDLDKFYLGYKSLDKKPEEYISRIQFDLPSQNTRFNFEKVSKRTNLDIASVNTAIRIEMSGQTMSKVTISAGGVGPVPMVLKSTSAFLTGKSVSEELLTDIRKQVENDISPISDARGTAEYKKLLLSQLIKAHFLKLFPSLYEAEVLKGGVR